MKIRFQKQSRKQGSALIITLTFGVILLVVLASYLMLLTSQKNLVTRSQTWNAALTMAEAGIEEGLAQVNASNSVFNFTAKACTNFSGNGWTKTGVLYGPKTNLSLLGGFYSATISNDLPPTIYSTGSATVPTVGGTISRAVKITTVQESLISVGLGAIGAIDFTGNGVATDSYNSHMTNLSTGGQYDSSKTSTNGDVASVGGLVNLGNHTIDGNLYLGANAGYGGSGTVSGNVVSNYNVQFPDVTLPPGSASWPTATAPTNNTYDFTTSGNYVVNVNDSIIVEAGVTVNLNVTATTFSPSSLLIHGGITNSGTAYLYLTGPTSVTMAGNTAVDASNRPENLYYFGTTNLTSITYSGNSEFIGVIYAPEASMTLNGGGNNSGIQGSAIVGNITMHGHYNFHYDESLAQSGPTRGYVANSWQELY
jgi:hypothetical protein